MFRGRFVGNTYCESSERVGIYGSTIPIVHTRRESSIHRPLQRRFWPIPAWLPRIPLAKVQYLDCSQCSLINAHRFMRFLATHSRGIAGTREREPAIGTLAAICGIDRQAGTPKIEVNVVSGRRNEFTRGQYLWDCRRNPLSSGTL
jgi:hypothetical protein